MVKQQRTQATRALDARKIVYSVHCFPKEIRDAVQVASALGVQPSQVFKTLVLIYEDNLGMHPILVMVPADHEVDLRRFARTINVKRVQMASHRQAEEITNLQVGGISALALLNRPFTVYIDKSVLRFEKVFVSGGQRGVDVQLSVDDLIAVTGALPIAVVDTE